MTEKQQHGVSRRTALQSVGAAALTVGTAAVANAQQENKEFNPNSLTFEQGLDRMKKAVEEATKGAGLTGIVTSRDPASVQLRESLAVRNIPQGFNKWQLPMALGLGKGVQLYISSAGPNVTVPRHSHDEGEGIRVIVSGSIIYNGIELTSGDWMYIPAGEPYEFKVGPNGVTQFYCYQCSCA